MRAAGAHTYLEKLLLTFTRKKRRRWRARHRRAPAFRRTCPWGAVTCALRDCAARQQPLEQRPKLILE